MKEVRFWRVFIGFFAFGILLLLLLSFWQQRKWLVQLSQDVMGCIQHHEKMIVRKMIVHPTIICPRHVPSTNGCLCRPLQCGMETSLCLNNLFKSLKDTSSSNLWCHSSFTATLWNTSWKHGRNMGFRPSQLWRSSILLFVTLYRRITRNGYHFTLYGATKTALNCTGSQLVTVKQDSKDSIAVWNKFLQIYCYGGSHEVEIDHHS